LAEDWQNGGFGIYVHWPFCQAKCPYCDFNSHVTQSIDQTRWADAYVTELDRAAQETPGRTLNTIFFGGGTPSLMSPDTVDAVIQAIRLRWPFSNDVEITLEANPGSVEAGRFAGYRDAGVNRISMGIQALNDRDLKRLGRIHTVDEAKRAFDVARSCFERVSFDLICARQDQTLADWQAELREALSMAIDHLSLYQLTVEDGTAFADRYRAGGLRGLPDEDRSADIYQATQEICESFGMPAYEVSNHARPGAESRHNLIYWRYGDYLGIGPGAHGRVTLHSQRVATENTRMPGAWLSGVESGSSFQTSEPLSARSQAEEYLLMGLRISEGIDTKRYSDLLGESLNAASIQHLTELGMIEQDNTRLWATSRGRMLLNTVISELVTP